MIDNNNWELAQELSAVYLQLQQSDKYSTLTVAEFVSLHLKTANLIEQELNRHERQ